MSQHPVDGLIRRLIHANRPPEPNDVKRIVERMATAPCDAQIVRVRTAERTATYRGRILGPRADALTYHLVKRVALEHQWADGTTAGQYLEDLRRAVRAVSARLVVYSRRGGHLAATVTPTGDVLPSHRQGRDSLSLLLVIYSADRGIILSGYGISGLDAASIPKEARWLK